jgi:trimeric autotransporter adhesin
MKSACQHIRSNARESWFAAAVVTLSLLTGYRAFALPTEGVVAAGQVTFSTPSATAMRIEQKSNSAIINWRSFGINRGEALNIAQPGTRSILLNRVTGNNPSEIFGTLSANGRIFLVNPNGILFAPGASVNVSGLVASTLAISDSDFFSEHYSFTRNGAPASVVNEGEVNGGFIALLGESAVTNSGTLVTTKGTTGMVVGEEITLNIDPGGLVALKVDKSAWNAMITNSGVIEADGGTVVITTLAAGELLASVVNNSGKVRASSMTERDGAIVIEGGTIINTGSFTASAINARGNNILDAGRWIAEGSARGGTIQIDAAGSIEQSAASQMWADGNDGGQIHLNAGIGLYLSGSLSANGHTGAGGQITVTAPHTLLAAARIEADGQSGGGSIFIGGGWQGKDGSLVNAATTTATKNSLLTANAVESGNGGRVAIWSELSTAFAGTIEAKGGRNSGNGGAVEVSSHDKLTFSGQTVTGSPHGNNGFLLLDPRNITIDTNTTIPLFSLISLPDANPAAGDEHGSGTILELGNGNILVASPLDDFVATDAGAVRLYKPDGTLLSMLCGSTANDQVGETVTALSSRNSAVTSTRQWSNAGQADAGAVTWINGTNGISGIVSESNSLVGSAASDGASSRVIALTNNNYVFSTPYWDNGTAIDAGAVTWGNGLGGSVGVISAANSLVGSNKTDQVGTVTALSNGNYVVSSLLWDNGAVTNAGAVTWSNGLGGTVGSISASNSLVGTKRGDQVGSVTALTNGNYTVSAPNWDNGTLTNAGMVTLVNGVTGAVGTVNAAKSLVGSKAGDQVGEEVTALTNGNFVVVSANWDNGDTIDAGAVTWGNGVSGTVGTISAANSLIGSANGDLASAHVTALTNGNFVVNSPYWDNGSVADAGAVTWGSGVGGSVGAISTANSLVGSTTKDAFASTVTALTNGNFVVASPNWDNGLADDVGAVTWGNGLGGTVGTISMANSLVGSKTNDGARFNITPLTNGSYVVGSPFWDNGSASDAGGVTWGNGIGGTIGVISAANSLVGSTKNDYAGSDASGLNKITALTNGNYVVSSTEWDKGSAANAGAVTWGDGLGGTVGAISAENSLVGSKTGDQVGSVTALPGGSYVVASPLWNNGSLANAGAITWLSGLRRTAGEISSSNSLPGSNKEDQLGIGGITPLTAGSMTGSFVVSSFNWSNKTGKVNILTPITEREPVQQEYSFNPDKDNSFTPGQITELLNAGEHVILKANNDITVNSAIVANNPLGNGGNLELNAGKSILVNANITTDNGNLTLIANEGQANGVVDAGRSAGKAAITMASGTTIVAGSANVTIELRDGAGNSNRESGEVTLRTITAGTISAVNSGPTAGSGITLASGTLTASASSGSSIILAGQNFDNHARAMLSTTGTARWIVYSANPNTTIKGGLTSNFRHYDASYSNYRPPKVSESGNGFIYIGIPSLTGPTLTWLTDAQNSGRIVVTDETIYNFSRAISAASPSNTIQKKSIYYAGKRSEKSGFIAGNTIEITQAAEAFFIFPLPVNLFSHSNPDAVFSLEVQSVNGSSIPFWMSFDPNQNVISGMPPNDAKGVYRIEFVAKDQFGKHARSVLLIKIG